MLSTDFLKRRLRPVRWPAERAFFAGMSYAVAVTVLFDLVGWYLLDSRADLFDAGTQLVALIVLVGVVLVWPRLDRARRAS